MNALRPIVLPGEALDRMMPMHVLVGPDGLITHVGPTLAKIHGSAPLVGQAFAEVFEFRRPCHTTDLEEVCVLAGAKFQLRLRDEARTQVIGTAVRVGDGQGVLVNLAFGISVVDAVARFNLAGSDFAATDLTVEMLYLVEANSAAMEESRKLNQKLNGAKALAEAEALSDTLTGLQNRRALDQVLARLIARRVPFTLMHLDLDFFKAVNDTLGHAAGDFVLKEVARVLHGETRESDAVARVGGDEFVLVFNKMTDQFRLDAIAARVIHRLEVPIDYHGEIARISASIGMVSSTIYPVPEANRMMSDADLALYASKDRGRACYTTFTPEMGKETPPEIVAEAQARAGH